MKFENTYRAATKTYADYDREIPAPYLRGVFVLKNVVKEAKISITSTGFYDLYINGVRITKGILAPYICRPDHFAVYDEYNITALLKEGKNAVGVILGNGFANPYGAFMWDYDKATFRAAPKTAFSVEADGVVVFSTCDTVKTAPSPFVRDELREGETYDARREIDGWALPTFDDSAWQDALVVSPPEGEKVLADFEPIQEYKKRRAVAIYPAEDGYIYDFEVNTAGIPILNIVGVCGQKVTLVCGEWLREGQMDTKNIQCGRRLERRMHDNQTVVYICKGKKNETFSPRFSYYGFRYVKVMGITPEQATSDLVVMSEQSSGFVKTARFYCSDMYANRTFENTLRSDFSNFYYFPTDCPHREKNGWTGDAYFSAEQFVLLMDCKKSLRMWLSAIRAAQNGRGAIPCIVPTGGFGYDWGNGPTWDGVLTALPYMLYRYTGDKEILQENADAIWRYLDFLQSLTNERGYIRYGLVDWCEIGGKSDSAAHTPNFVTDTCSAIDICDKAACIFGVLGQTARQKAAERQAFDFREAARDAFIDWDNAATAYCRTQTAQAQLLYRGVFRKEEYEQAAFSLREMVIGSEKRMRVGVLGIQALLRVLCESGNADLAYEIAMSPDRPSFGNQIAHGATSLCEFIHIYEDNSDKIAVGRLKSMNHHFWGDIAAWYMTYLAGIRVNEAFTDPACVDIAPYFVGQLDYASAMHRMPQGEVISSWQRMGKNKIELYVRIPKGTHGELRLSDGWQSKSGTRISENGCQFTLIRRDMNA